MSKLLKVLFVAASPDGRRRLRLDREAKQIQAALERSKLGDRFRLETWWASSFDDLLDGLLRQEPQVVQYSGHGRPDALLLEGADQQEAPVSIAALVRLFKAQAGRVKIVVLNACDSVAAARGIAPYVDCTVGMAEPIGDDAAIAFAGAFYRTLGYGRSVAEAVELGRSAIDAAGFAGADEVHLVPRLGLDPAQIRLVVEQEEKPIEGMGPPPGLYDAMCGLMPSQLDEIILRMGLRDEHIAPRSETRAKRAMDVLSLAQQGGSNRMAELQAELRRATDS